jgi:hypothetical protein
LLGCLGRFFTRNYLFTTVGKWFGFATIAHKLNVRIVKLKLNNELITETQETKHGLRDKATKLD